MIIERAGLCLRTDFLQTRRRPKTTGVFITSTLTDQRQCLDANAFDVMDAALHKFGVGFHYLVLPDGKIQICRHPLSVSSYGPDRLRETHIAIAWVGGRDGDTGEFRKQDVTPAQHQAIEELIQMLADTLQVPLEVEDGNDLFDEIENEETIEEIHQEKLDAAELTS